MKRSNQIALSEEEALNALDFIRRHVAPLPGKRVLDIGCGKGALAKALSAEGARVVGVDPAEAALGQARITAPAATFECSGAEALPFPDEMFDAAIFLNALHHVPPKSMRQALAEARRVTREDGRILVIEPLAQGSFNEVLKFVNDETEVRALAQAALVETAAADGFEHGDTIVFTRREPFDGFDGFVTRATAADPARNEIVARHRAQIEAAFHHFAAREDGLYWLDQPLKADVLARRP